MKLIKLPLSAASTEGIPSALRRIADRIETGEMPCTHLVWVMDFADQQLEVGMLGESPSPGAEAHLMLACAMRKLETVL